MFVVLVRSMLCGAHPFDLEGNSPENEVTERARTTTVPLEGLGDEISDSAKDLISRYIQWVPRFFERPVTSLNKRS